MGLESLNVINIYWMWNLEQETKIFRDEVHFSGKVYISLVFGTARKKYTFSRKGCKINNGKTWIHLPGRSALFRVVFLEKVHFFQEDLFEFWFLEQPSDHWCIQGHVKLSPTLDVPEISCSLFPSTDQGVGLWFNPLSFAVFLTPNPRIYELYTSATGIYLCLGRIV